MPMRCAHLIAGMASPVYRGHEDHKIPAAISQQFSDQHNDAVASYLQQHGVCAVISFEESLNADFKLALEQCGISYLHFPMRGSYDKNLHFPVHSPAVLDQFYQTICDMGGSVVFHCMGGMGRTGTHLAALMLRRKINDQIRAGMSKASLRQLAQQKPMRLLPSENICSHMQPVDYAMESVPCTQLVADVVNQLRQIELTRGNKAHFAVETAQQIQALCDYQIHLLA